MGGGGDGCSAARGAGRGGGGGVTNQIYGLCVIVSMFAAWRSFDWLADRLMFSSVLGVMVGRTLTSAILGFVVAGLCLEIFLLLKSNSTNSAIQALDGQAFSSFGAGVFGAIFGAIFGLGWGIVRGTQEARTIGSDRDKWSMSLQQSDYLVWVLPTILTGAAIYFFGMAFQTQPENVFGQVCLRAHSTVQRVGGTCFRPEWMAIGAIVAVVAFLSLRSVLNNKR
jgi:hypothetical protein